MTNIIQLLGEHNMIALHRLPQETIAAGNRIVADSKRARREPAGWQSCLAISGPRAGARDFGSGRKPHEHAARMTGYHLRGETK